MSSKKNISDDEIRIITPNREKRSTSPGWFYYVIGIAAVAVIVAVWFLLRHENGGENDEKELLTVTQDSTSSKSKAAVDTLTRRGYVDITDTIISGKSYTILTPRGATAQLHIGTDVLGSRDVVLAMQAADIRADNGGIVGACVVNGDLVSKGEAKSGFCAIIDGIATIGVADASPFLERAIESEGYFFRQYPLVVAHQLVENKPKGRSLRKALAEWNGTVVVILSHERLTFHDFAQALVDMGVTNAIYLVGSNAAGFAVDARGHRYDYGSEVPDSSASTNYIVWR
ncbi:MAG: hypothetical protein ACI4AK_05175 [Lepagella sp.]